MSNQAMLNLKRKSLSWTHGIFNVESLGGMIGPANFILPNGRQVSPFHIAPWVNEPDVQTRNDLTAGLRGEWPCVPFGYPMERSDFPKEWQSAMPENEAPCDVHGFSSNNHWVFNESEDEIDLTIKYPQHHVIKSLNRKIKPDPNMAALDFTLRISARRETKEPLALHGCFALPQVNGAAKLKPGKFKTGRTHPGRVEPASPLFAADQRFEKLEQVPAFVGGMVDASCLPFRQPVEELLQLDDIDGSFEMINTDDQYRMRFTWDNKILPSVLLWYSNRGRSQFPWNSRHQCIGIEPVCSPFGLSPDTARAQNPIAKSGTPTAVKLSPNQDLKLDYRIEIHPL